MYNCNCYQGVTYQTQPKCDKGGVGGFPFIIVLFILLAIICCCAEAPTQEEEECVCQECYHDCCYEH